jgi:hypothetical protein
MAQAEPYFHVFLRGDTPFSPIQLTETPPSRSHSPAGLLFQNKPSRKEPIVRLGSGGGIPYRSKSGTIRIELSRNLFPKKRRRGIALRRVNTKKYNVAPCQGIRRTHLARVRTNPTKVVDDGPKNLGITVTTKGFSPRIDLPSEGFR